MFGNHIGTTNIGNYNVCIGNYIKPNTNEIIIGNGDSST